MKAARRYLALVLIMGGMSVLFQNCHGSGQNMPSATELASSTLGGGGTGSGGGGSQWWCTAEGSSVHLDGDGNPDYSNLDPISMTGVENDRDAAGLKALDACSGIMSIQTSLGTEAQHEPCQVTECHAI